MCKPSDTEPVCPFCSERALDVVAAVCLTVVVLRLLLRSLPRQVKEIRRNLADFQVRPCMMTVKADHSASIFCKLLVEVRIERHRRLSVSRMAACLVHPVLRTRVRCIALCPTAAMLMFRAFGSQWCRSTS